MAVPKSFKDLSIASVEINHDYFSEEALKAIKTKHNFSNDFDLQGVIDEEISWYTLLLDMPTELSPKQVIERLEAVQKKLKEVAQMFSRLSTQENTLISKNADVLAFSFEPISNIDNLNGLSTMLSLALVSYKNTNGTMGSPVKMAQARFINGLIDIYKTGTNKEPSYTYDNYSEPQKYKGDFIKFSETIIEFYSLDIKNSAIGLHLKNKYEKK